jgi:3-hydroxyacyl-CoA dehydrogenase
MEQSDHVGLDLTLDIAAVLYADLDRTAGPHPFLRQKVDDGRLGMKTGEGFRHWTPESAAAVRQAPLTVSGSAGEGKTEACRLGQKRNSSSDRREVPTSCQQAKSAFSPLMSAAWCVRPN